MELEITDELDKVNALSTATNCVRNSYESNNSVFLPDLTFLQSHS